MGRLLLYAVLWAWQAALVLLLVSAAWVAGQGAAERASAVRYLGPVASERLLTNATRRYDAIFIESGAVAASYRMLLPDRTRDQKGMEHLAPWLSVWVKGRLDAFWWVVFQGLYRLGLIALWLPALAPLLIALAVDGLVQRQVSKARQGYANPVRYHSAWHTLIVLAILPALYLTVPLACHPLLVPLWAIALGAVLRLLLANLQHRL